MSLRQTKKDKTTRAILEAASARFIIEGIDSTRMEEIAADAEVSVGTLYNYFGSKQSLLMALFEVEVKEMLGAGGIAVSGDLDPLDTVRHLFDAYLDVMIGTNRDLLREVLRFSLGGGAAVQELARLDEDLMSQLAGLLASHQESGRISTTIGIEDATFVLYSVLMTELLMYLTLDDLEAPLLRSNVARRVELVFEGINL